MPTEQQPDAIRCQRCSVQHDLDSWFKVGDCPSCGYHTGVSEMASSPAVEAALNKHRRQIEAGVIKESSR